MKAKHFLLVALALMAGCTKPGDDGNKPTPVDPSQDVAVTGITVSPGSAQLAVGGTVTLTATVTPDNATDKTVTWSSSDNGVATVAGGLVTGVAAGSATITAKAGDKTATCVITVTGSEPPAEDYTAYYKKNYWDRTDREKLGLNGPVKTWKYTKSEHTVYEYDQEGHLLTERVYFSADETQQRGVRKHTYDSQGHRIKTVEYSGDEQYVYEEITFEYNNPGKIVPTTGDFTENDWALCQSLIEAKYSLLLTNYYSGLRDQEATFIKDLSAMTIKTPETISYGEEIYSYKFVFGADGNLTTTWSWKHPSGKDNATQAWIYTTDEESWTWTYSGNYPATSSKGISNLTWQDNGMPATMTQTLPPRADYPDEDPRVTTFVWLEDPRALRMKTMKVESGWRSALTIMLWEDELNDQYELKTITSQIWNGSLQDDNHPFSSYKYDSYGNWTKRSMLVNPMTGTPYDDNMARTITYYDTPAGPAYVDLGLSVYWGTSNVGTDEWSPRGRYYGWGETYEHRSSEGERKYRSYDWPTYKWCNYPSGNIGVPPSYIKYFSDPVHGSNPDYKTELDLEDDAAHVVLGGEWRMPTAQEFEELKATKNNAGYKWEWKTIDSVEGMEITYLKNGSSIFLQASGYKYSDQQDVFNESMGHYWSSTKVEDNDHRAKSYVFGAFQQYKLDDYRCYGCNIRPVLPK